VCVRSYIKGRRKNMAKKPLLHHLLCLVLGSCGTSDIPTAPSGPVIAKGEIVRSWVTTPDRSKLLFEQPGMQFRTDSAASVPSFIDIDQETTFQRMYGVGAAFTHSSTTLINGLPNEKQNQLLQELFGSGGIGLNYMRLPFGASDFISLPEPFTYDDVPAGKTDSDLAQFTINSDRSYTIPVILSALQLNPSLQIMGSPWSAPAWMKTNELIKGGSLKREFYPVYARYLAKCVSSYKDAGINIGTITVVNEPLALIAPTYPHMWMEAVDQADFIANHLGPLFKNSGINTQIFTFDHNWDNIDYPIQVLDHNDARQYVAGTAFHCYGGDVKNQNEVHTKFPDKEIYFTECSGTQGSSFGGDLKWNMHNLIIGVPNNWGSAIMLWNLALDEKGNPHLGGCENCRGVVTIRNDGTIEKNVEYYVLGHYGKAVQPGAYRIKSLSSNGKLETVAFINPNGSKVLIILNNEDSKVEFKIRWGGQIVSASLEGGAVATYTW